MYYLRGYYLCHNIGIHMIIYETKTTENQGILIVRGKKSQEKR